MTFLKDFRESGTADPMASGERRHVTRGPATFPLMYSGLSMNGVLMGDGTVIDISGAGLGVQGTCPVIVGMELSMLLYLPDGDDPLFVMEATVSWMTGTCFGVEFKKLHLREGNRLQVFLRAQSSQQTQSVGP